MKRTGQARRRVRAASSPGLSMFPFLAVLICTIGSLVVLLVVITRQARIQAAIAAAEAAAEAQRDAHAKREMAEWRIDQLEHSRVKTAEQVADLRGALGHLEDHARTLETELQQLKRTWEALAQGEDSLRKAAVEAQLERTRAEIREAEKALTDAERRVASQPPSFAVVPYQGPGETRRQPMYIECRGDAVVLQPEEITLRAEDFDGPDGPGNPLAAALRAKREYLLTYGNLDPRTAGEPYPLLIVRPNGIGAYYAARNAMSSWGAEFGYELVDAGWKVEFQPPDQQLAAMLRRTVDAARVRQEQLAAAAPRHYGTQRSQTYYRAAPGGGITVDGGERTSSRTSPRPSPRYARPGGATASGSERTGENGSDRAFGASGGDGLDPRRSAESHADSGTTVGFVPSDARRSGGESDGSSASGGTERSDAARPDAMGRPAAGSASGQPTGSASGQPAGSASGQPAGEASGQPAGEAGGRPLQLGEWRDPQSLRPMAEKKGRDWALPNANQRATPIMRPIRLECHADRLLLPSPAGVAAGRTVQLRASTAESVDDFVAAVWDVIDGWGIAGRDMYWSPVLEVRVAPDAEHRYRDLEVLLNRSGLTLERL